MNKKLRRPNRLAPGDVVGIVAPASPFKRKSFKKGISALESMGFVPRFSDDIFEASGYLAGSDVHRAEQVNGMFADPSIKAIICARGGYGGMRILPYLDFESIKQHPKIFLGFSDISALLWTLGVRCNLATFHGPVVTSLGKATDRAKRAFLRAVSSGDAVEISSGHGSPARPGRASGPTVGGNLTTLCHLVGTPYAPDFEGCILILEDRNEAVYRIDRMLVQMKLAGCLDGIRGLVLGDFDECGAIEKIIRIVEDIFADDAIPIMAGFDIGHGKTNLTVPMGLDATLDADEGRLRFHSAGTRSLKRK
ncbi:MAG: LD-carboxypeptidase [Desulfobacterales bacterium]|nr:LD-carboxypeptidase [Desulfobacterales bacterium]